MEIDEAITWLNTDDYESKGFAEATSVAIEIMRKYQKIARIMERTVDDGTSMYDTLQEIEEVVEDGDDTTNTGSN